MYCCTCGTKCPENAPRCPSCGSVQLPERASVLGRVEPSSRTPIQSDDETIALQRLSVTDVKSDQCHGCGSKDQLLAYPFALAKKMNVQRDWAGTAASVAISAVSIPLTGFGIFQTPGKRTTYRIIRMTLILCPECRKRRVSYELHPWWNGVLRLGYTKFFDRYDLGR